MTDKEREYVERVGLLHERMGQPRMPGLIIGYLLIADPPGQSAKDIRKALGVSHASVSICLRSLMNIGFVERAAVPGSRSKRYRIKEGAWTLALEKYVLLVSEMKAVAEEGLSLLNPDGDARSHLLSEWHAYYDFMEAELGAVFRRWETRDSQAEG